MPTASAMVLVDVPVYPVVVNSSPAASRISSRAVVPGRRCDLRRGRPARVTVITPWLPTGTPKWGFALICHTIETDDTHRLRVHAFGYASDTHDRRGV